jgi:pimeloyl-ACP methyl ester carboxylesterase
MDRRGRGSSGDSEPYSCSTEFEDIAAVGAHLADGYGSAIDVFAHSIGATFTLGAAATSNHFRRIALYEPPGPETVSRGWTDSVSASIANGQAGRAAFRFFTEIVGLTREQVEARRDAPGDQDVLAIVAATMPREARALEGIDLVATARAIGSSPVLLLLGSESPSWAREITTSLAEALAAEVVSLPGQGHEAIDGAPELVLHALDQFFDGDSVS